MSSTWISTILSVKLAHTYSISQSACDERHCLLIVYITVIAVYHIQPGHGLMVVFSFVDKQQ